MEPFRLNVVPRGKGYVAESRDPQLTALGSSPEEAAENARLMALALYVNGARQSTLIVRTNGPALCTIVMQPIDKPVTPVADGEELEWRYMASVTNPLVVEAAE